MDTHIHNQCIWRSSNVVLRLPSVFILEALYHSRTKFNGTAESLASSWGLEPQMLTLGSQYLGRLYAYSYIMKLNLK